jgi:hypothetical protein
MRDLLHFAIPNAADEMNAAAAPSSATSQAPLSAKADALVHAGFVHLLPILSLRWKIERLCIVDCFCVFIHSFVVLLVLWFWF